MTADKMPPLLFIEQILSSITVLGLIFLCIGLPLHIAGRIYEVLIMAQVGAYVFLIGLLLVSMRVFYRILEKIVEYS
jgi:hypothetical protein